MRIRKGEGKEEGKRPDPNTNLLWSKTVIPVAEYNIHKGRNELETEVIY